MESTEQCEDRRLGLVFDLAAKEACPATEAQLLATAFTG